jgi:hypothetical protein
MTSTQEKFMSKTSTSLIATAALLALTACTTSGHGGHSPYAGFERREIKALSAEQMRQLETGAGMALAQPAELNGWPGPMHVLEHADALALTSQQRDATQALMRAHKQRAAVIGREVIAAEKALDRAFAEQRIDDASLRRLTAAAADRMAALRAEHLATHIAQTRSMEPAQVARYQQLRGYATP